jgi:hypothetical protein
MKESDMKLLLMLSDDIGASDFDELLMSSVLLL